jgi:hypothetical protein
VFCGHVFSKHHDIVQVNFRAHRLKPALNQITSHFAAMDLHAATHRSAAKLIAIIV